MYPVVAIIFVVLFTLIIVSMSYWYYKTLAAYAKLPSVSVWPVIVSYVLGKTPKDMSVSGFFLQKLLETSTKYDSEGLFVAWFERPYVMTCSEEAVKLLNNDPSIVNKPNAYELLHDTFGVGLAFLEREAWKTQRRLLNPVFHVTMLKNKVEIFNKNSVVLVQKLTKVAKESSLDISECIFFCAFMNLRESLFGLEVTGAEKISEMETFIDLLLKSSHIVANRVIHPWLRSKYALPFFAEGRKYRRCVKEIRNFVLKMVLEIEDKVRSEMKGEMDEEDAVILKKPHKSFSSVLFQRLMDDTSYTMHNVKDEVSTFLITGYESVGNALMWCIFALGHRPDVQEQIYEELQNCNENYISHDDLQKLTYMDCAIKESFRLYPTVPLFARRLEKSIQCGKYVIPENATVLFSPYTYHRNPNVYSNPDKYQPERFLEGNPENRPWAFIPFAEGARSCIGKKYALMEMKIILAHIIRNFEITSLDREEDLNFKWEIVLTTVKPLRIRITPRKRAENNN